jgi:hypothetical protein
LINVRKIFAPVDFHDTHPSYSQKGTRPFISDRGLTMQYILLIYGTEGKDPQPGSEAFGPYMQGYAEFSQQVKDAGQFVAGEALQSVATATTVTLENGKVETMDGPFAETKEQLGGFYILECADLDEALKLAEQIPTAKYGRVEVRPIMTFD